MKVLLTGATGLLGGHLLQALQARGEHIRALVLPVENAQKLIAQDVEVVRGDVTDASTLAPAVKDVDLIIHLAGMMGVNRPAGRVSPGQCHRLREPLSCGPARRCAPFRPHQLAYRLRPRPRSLPDRERCPAA